MEAWLLRAGVGVWLWALLGEVGRLAQKNDKRHNTNDITTFYYGTCVSAENQAVGEGVGL